MSSWRRFHVFESSCPSFVSSYCFLRGTPGLSSCREIFLSLMLFLEASQWVCFVVASFSCPLCSVDHAIYEAVIGQLFPPSFHEAHMGQSNMAKKVTEVTVVSIVKDALAKIENKTEEQQPSTPTGRFRGWPSSRGPRPPLFL